MSNSNKIQRVSIVLQYLCYAFIALATFFVLGSLFNLLVSPEVLQEYIADAAIPTLIRISEASASRAIPATLIFFTPVALIMYAYWRLSQLFGVYKQGIYFSDANADHLFAFALISFIGQLLGFPIIGIADYVVTIGVADIPYGMPFFIDGDEIPNLILSGAFLTISWIMREGIRIANENAEFV